MVNGGPPGLQGAAHVDHGVVDEQRLDRVEVELPFDFPVGLQLRLAVTQPVAVDDLPECPGEALPVLLEDLPFEMLGMQGIRVAEQQQVKPGGEVVEQGEHLRS